MSITWCKEITGRSGEAQKNSRRRYTRTFQIITDTTTDGAKVVRDYIELPDYGERWEEVDFEGTVTDFDENARCVEKRAVQNDENNLCNWMVYCEYAGVDDPTQEPPEVEWTDEKYQENYTQDALGVDCVNAAGDPFAAGLTRDRTRLVVIITENVLSYDPIEMLDYVDTTNESPFLAANHPPGFGVGLCKIDSITAKAFFWEDWPDNTEVHYWRRTVKVSIHRDGWDQHPLNAGFQSLLKDNGGNYILDGDGGKKKVRIMRGAIPASTPQLLKDDGTELKPGESATFKDFSPYPPKEWSPLNLEY